MSLGSDKKQLASSSVLAFDHVDMIVWHHPDASLPRSCSTAATSDRNASVCSGSPLVSAPSPGQLFSPCAETERSGYSRSNTHRVPSKTPGLGYSERQHQM